MQGTGDCAYNLAGLDLNARTVLTGSVQSVNLIPGQNPPTFIIRNSAGQATIVACPLQPIMRSNFQISVNDRVSVAAYPMPNAAGTYLAAEIDNLTTKTSVKVRDDNGMPIMTRGGGSGKCGVCCNLK